MECNFPANGKEMLEQAIQALAVLADNVILLEDTKGSLTESSYSFCLDQLIIDSVYRRDSLNNICGHWPEGKKINLAAIEILSRLMDRIIKLYQSPTPVESSIIRKKATDLK